MNITSFKVSQDKSVLQLVLSDNTATSLKLWTNKTYKVEGLEIDLSEKLGTTTINISPEDLGITYFDGVYFVDVSNDTDSVCGIAAELTRYKECILDKVLANKDCASCLEIGDVATLNAHVLLITLESALELGLPQEILNLVFALDKFCSNDCNGCGKHKEI